MKVRDILKEKGGQVYSIADRAVVADALAELGKRNIGALIVLDGRRQVRGIISERDIIRHSRETRTDFKQVAVREIMTPFEKLIVAKQEDDVEKLLSVMTGKRIRHLPVLDDNGELCGLVSSGDLIKATLQDREYQIRYLKDYIENKYPR